MKHWEEAIVTALIIWIIKVASHTPPRLSSQIYASSSSILSSSSSLLCFSLCPSSFASGASSICFNHLNPTVSCSPEVHCGLSHHHSPALCSHSIFFLFSPSTPTICNLSLCFLFNNRLTGWFYLFFWFRTDSTGTVLILLFANSQANPNWTIDRSDRRSDLIF